MDLDYLSVECPECGSKPGVVCFSTDVVAGFGRVEEGHKERHDAAAWAYLHSANPPQILSLDQPPIPARFDFRAYGGVAEVVDKTFPVWHMLKRVQPMMKTWPRTFTSQLVKLITKMQALDELRAQGAQEEVLRADKDALRALTLAFLEKYYPEYSDKYDTVLTIMGVME